jgi:2-amino-4-hydroxy-6-hydroxymethyldihydropteridine diphosphokinase
MINVIIALGGNLGNVTLNFDLAIQKLKQSGLQQIIKSSNYNTAAVDCPPNSPDFINAVISGFWQNTPEQLLAVCKKIELESGRAAEHAINSPRTLDLDIILFGDLIVRQPQLIIPHPKAASRRFVLEPMAEILPNLRFPNSNKTVLELLNAIL